MLFRSQYRAPVDVSSLDDPGAREMIGDDIYAHFRDSLDIIRDAGTRFSVEEYRAGRQTPVFFGSALTNFGLEPFLQALVELAPSPQPRQSDTGMVMPTDERFTGFVFKIQANMDPRHRDRVAFVRICSGRFTKDMVLSNSRMGKVLRASRAYRFFGRDRETIEVAYAGDVIGLVNPGQFAIGDTLHSGTPVKLPELPRFPAEHFGRVRLKDTRYKQFAEGLKQLEEEGLMQLFYVIAGGREPIVGVGGNHLVTKEKAGLRNNDECWKMAVTDALSVALKMLGVAADIYAGRWDGSKFRDEEPADADTPYTNWLADLEIVADNGLDELLAAIKKSSEDLQSRLRADAPAWKALKKKAEAKKELAHA